MIAEVFPVRNVHKETSAINISLKMWFQSLKKQYESKLDVNFGIQKIKKIVDTFIFY